MTDWINHTHVGDCRELSSCAGMERVEAPVTYRAKRKRESA